MYKYLYLFNSNITIQFKCNGLIQCLILSCFLICNFSFGFNSFENNTNDYDGDGVYDENDIDIDGDGITNDVEDGNEDGDNCYWTYPTDTDADGIPDYLDIDSDNDGLLDNLEAQNVHIYESPSGIDLNHNGLDDIYEQFTPIGIQPDDSRDNDGFTNQLDLDSDDDGIPDNVEG
ncbi:hypothetical protein RM542_14620, partial [Croceitalea sp. P059]|nr:hypothetical protein [Croceitalea sp. P059]